MRKKSLTIALDLQGFHVRELTMGNEHIDIEMGRDELYYVCARCGQLHFTYHDRHRITPQDLSISGRRVYLHLWRHRVNCDCSDNPVSEEIEHVRPRSRMTKRFEESLHDECKETPINAVAERHHLSWAAVRNNDYRILRRKIDNQSLDNVRRIGIDEIAHQKRHKYLTVITDLDRRKVIRIVNERKAKSLSAFFKEFGKDRCEKIECVVIDMWRPYRKAIQRHLKNAIIITDKFHVSKKVHEALDQVRKDEQAKLPKDEYRFLKGSRWLLLQTLETTNKKDRVPKLIDLLLLNENLLKGYILKEEFRSWYSLKPETGESNKAYIERVKSTLRKWYRHVHESDLEPFEKAVRTVKNWRGSILNYFLTGLSNGLAEGLNNVIKTIKKRAYGFRNKEYFSLKIYQKVGLI